MGPFSRNQHSLCLSAAEAFKRSSMSPSGVPLCSSSQSGMVQDSSQATTDSSLKSELVYLLRMQAVEYGVCAHLAELAVSENPEAHEAAALALSTLLQGTSTSVQAAPAVGSNAAAAVCRKPPAAELTTPGSPVSDTIPAGNFRAGGGIPSSTLLPLLQMVAMHGVNDIGVDLRSTLHALRTASSEEYARRTIMKCELVT
jgi:hypothetical protein